MPTTVEDMLNNVVPLADRQWLKLIAVLTIVTDSYKVADLLSILFFLSNQELRWLNDWGGRGHTILAYRRREWSMNEQTFVQHVVQALGYLTQQNVQSAIQTYAAQSRVDLSAPFELPRQWYVYDHDGCLLSNGHGPIHYACFRGNVVHVSHANGVLADLFDVGKIILE